MRCKDVEVRCATGCPGKNGSSECCTHDQRCQRARGRRYAATPCGLSATSFSASSSASEGQYSCGRGWVTPLCPASGLHSSTALIHFLGIACTPYTAPKSAPHTAALPAGSPPWAMVCTSASSNDGTWVSCQRALWSV